ncbi:phage baseplate assembly protein V [Ralstonia solanacearum]|uniref:phage baseplate assembly protein V n=1 Tax=Ralstonia solanacearum TaxID=305 RepID=UPI0005AC82A3|nr:phage baseplate assembly protein V [Ralstonia solanacearum]MCL9826619.1 phage baseplate assembly protein V [Ralstonia solanacearum]MCL9831431.1 phage baseplate assembly protein V [Ralstonia solanacearum]MCL9836212.1 phage baseplate assembly protein V [Ralstonia solanacearum]
MTDFARLVAPYARRLSNMVARGTVSLVNAATKMQSLQLRLLAGESKDDVEHFEPYGLTSHPQTGAECVALFLDGDRSHGVVVCVADRRYRIKGLASGEVILHDDQGQSVYLMRGGVKLTDKAGSTVVMQGDGSGSMTFAAGLTINANSKIVGTLEVTQDITSDASITAARDVGDQGGAKTMAGMREIYNGHTHAGTDSHGDGFITNPPNQQE